MIHIHTTPENLVRAYISHDMGADYHRRVARLALEVEADALTPEFGKDCAAYTFEDYGKTITALAMYTKQIRLRTPSVAEAQITGLHAGERLVVVGHPE